MRFLYHASTRRLLRVGMIAAVALLGGAALVLGREYQRDMRESERRITGRSEVIHTSFSQLEYAVAGKGRDVLMIHGTGGGFDQGLTFTEALVRRGFRVIAPSRFGYLRSDFPEDPSSEHQADAFVELLDRLGVAKVPVAGGVRRRFVGSAVRASPPEPMLGAGADRAGGQRATLAGHPARMDFSKISVPTLIISVEDGRLARPRPRETSQERCRARASSSTHPAGMCGWVTTSNSGRRLRGPSTACN